MSLKSGRAAPNKKDCTVFVVREDISNYARQQLGVCYSGSEVVMLFMLLCWCEEQKMKK